MFLIIICRRGERIDCPRSYQTPRFEHRILKTRRGLSAILTGRVIRFRIYSSNGKNPDFRIPAFIVNPDFAF